MTRAPSGLLSFRALHGSDTVRERSSSSWACLEACGWDAFEWGSAETWRHVGARDNAALEFGTIDTRLFTALKQSCPQGSEKPKQGPVSSQLFLRPDMYLVKVRVKVRGIIEGRLEVGAVTNPFSDGMLFRPLGGLTLDVRERRGVSSS